MEAAARARHQRTPNIIQALQREQAVRRLNAQIQADVAKIWAGVFPDEFDWPESLDLAETTNQTEE